MTGAQSLRTSRMALLKAAAFFFPGLLASRCNYPESDMQLRRCTNKDCRRPYQISRCDEWAARHSTGKLNCPHCGHVEALWEDDRFSLDPLTEAQEALFDVRHPAGFPFSRAGSR